MVHYVLANPAQAVFAFVRDAILQPGAADFKLLMRPPMPPRTKDPQSTVNRSFSKR